MSASTESSQLIDYRGNCHCGAFKFTFKAPELKQVFGCNCSICSKNGYMWAFPASSEHFAIVKGDEDTTLKSYAFGKHTMTHKFCPACGTSVMARKHQGDGQSVAINVRALMDVDLDSLQILMSDGAAVEPLYQAPEPLAVGPVPEGTTVYNGNCHCGAVEYMLLSTEKILKATDCNCSSCSRMSPIPDAFRPEFTQSTKQDAALWIYTDATRVTFKGLDSLVEYMFGLKTTRHGFCKTCGVAIREVGRTTALNVRTMNGLDVAALEMIKLDGKADLPLYEVPE
ncbi:Mss4-like protein [Mycena epipterygia]|nr:Mss4-like protein [Mycena epipterygia]